jgi:hypothetical protein
MAMSPEARAVEWPLERVHHPTASAILAISNTALGIGLTFEVFRATPGLSSWLARWLRAYLELGIGKGISWSESSFAYVYLGDIAGGSPSGQVDGIAVLEAGYGCEPVGPQDGVLCSTPLLFSVAAAVLASSGSAFV